MIAAIIIARGGSVRLPRKNVLPFCGLPLVAWSVIQAKCSNLIDEVYVSTDDDEIAEIGDHYGATIIRRPDWPNPDELQGGVPMTHAVKLIQEQRDDLDLMISVLPTNPGYYPDDMDRMIKAWHDVGDPGASMTMEAPNDELKVRRDIGGGRSKCVIMDKTPNKWLAPIAHRTVTTPQLYLDGVGLPTDKEIDTLSAAREFDNWPDETAQLFIEGKLWQSMVDTDTAERFELGEALMEHYILQGKGRSVYDEYGEDYTQFVGNARQL